MRRAPMCGAGGMTDAEERAARIAARLAEAARARGEREWRAATLAADPAHAARVAAEAARGEASPDQARLMRGDRVEILPETEADRRFRAEKRAEQDAYRKRLEAAQLEHGWKPQAVLQGLRDSMASFGKPIMGAVSKVPGLGTVLAPLSKAVDKLAEGGRDVKGDLFGGRARRRGWAPDDPRRAALRERGAAVRKLMAERGMSMPEASRALAAARRG